MSKRLGAVAALSCPQICQIHDAGEDYLVLEYIDGSPLSDAAGVGFAIAGHIVSALEAAHSMTDDEDATQTMAVSGTLLYMSPEKAEAKRVDAAFVRLSPTRRPESPVSPNQRVGHDGAIERGNQ